MTIDTKNLRVLCNEINTLTSGPREYNGFAAYKALAKQYRKATGRNEMLALLDALERKDRVIRSIKQEAETALVIGDEIGMRDGLVQILKEADQEFGITTRN